jgi:hypothetical protein
MDGDTLDDQDLRILQNLAQQIMPGVNTCPVQTVVGGH